MHEDSRPKIVDRNSNHPISFNFRGQEFSFTEDDPPEKRLRLISRSQMLSPYWQTIFKGLFPEDEQIVPVKPFNSKTISRDERSKLTDDLRKVHRALYHYLGFERPKMRPTLHATDIKELHTAFTEDPNALTSKLNELPNIKLLGDRGQTDPQLSFISERRRLKTTRLQHSQDLARSVAFTNLRLALNDPKKYIARVKEDMSRYGLLAEALTGSQEKFDLNVTNGTKRQVDEILNQYFSSINTEKTVADENKEELIKATQYALQYSQYMIIGAYFHDVFTPGWGDIFMKAKGKAKNQVPVEYSEDRELFEQAEFLVSDREIGLFKIVEDFSLDKNLLTVMLKSLATEGDPCLPGYLFKDKHKYVDVIRNALPWLPYDIQSLDHDQRSGNRTNIAEITSQYFPGGFIHLSGNDEKTLPIGSFEERVRLLAFFIANRMSTDEIVSVLSQMQIDPNKVFITAEEIDIGPNLRLEEVFFLDNQGKKHSEILPVALDPGAVKRSALLFNFLSIFYYQHEERKGLEQLMQDCINSGLFPNPQTGHPVLRPHDFISRTDSEVYSFVNREAPLLGKMFEIAGGKMRIVTKDELQKLVPFLSNAGFSFLAKKTVMNHLINLKEGSLAMNDDGSVDYWDEILKTKINGKDNQESVALRLIKTKELLEKEDLYLFMPLSAEDIDRIKALIEMHPASAYAFNNVLSLWTEPIEFEAANTINNPLHEVFSGNPS